MPIIGWFGVGGVVQGLRGAEGGRPGLGSGKQARLQGRFSVPWRLLSGSRGEA